MKKIPAWSRETLLQSPLFAPLHPILARLPRDTFPSLQACNALLAASDPPVTVQNGAAVHFVPQQSGKLAFEAQYEPRCYQTGEVQMRANNWHDLFNALVWLSFPRTKAALNARHFHALMEERSSGSALRGALRDVNTLLDESGVIVVYADRELAELLRDFRWKELFWQRREQLKGEMGFVLFGHGLYEKALQPYIGMTGQGLLIEVDQDFYDWPTARQLAHLDNLLANDLARQQRGVSTRELSPVPLLGMPGWAEDNNSQAYYDNADYFRTGRRA